MDDSTHYIRKKEGRGGEGRGGEGRGSNSYVYVLSSVEVKEGGGGEGESRSVYLTM